VPPGHDLFAIVQRLQARHWVGAGGRWPSAVQRQGVGTQLPRRAGLDVCEGGQPTRPPAAEGSLWRLPGVGWLLEAVRDLVNLRSIESATGRR
jgi:hypothetical protein